MFGFYSKKNTPQSVLAPPRRANNENTSENYSSMLEGKNAHYLILKGLEAGWLYLIEERVDNGKLMAGPDKPRLIFKNNLRD